MVEAGHRRHPVARARRQRQVVVAEPLAVAEHELPGRAIDALDALAQPQVDGLVPEERRALQRQAAIVRRLQEFLGKRRSLVGQERLLADNRHRSVEAALAQRRGEFDAAMAGADDDDPLRGGAHAATSRTASRGRMGAGMEVCRVKWSNRMSRPICRSATRRAIRAAA